MSICKCTSALLGASLALGTLGFASVPATAAAPLTCSTFQDEFAKNIGKRQSFSTDEIKCEGLQKLNYDGFMTAVANPDRSASFSIWLAIKNAGPGIAFAWGSEISDVVINGDSKGSEDSGFIYPATEAEGITALEVTYSYDGGNYIFTLSKSAESLWLNEFTVSEVAGDTDAPLLSSTTPDDDATDVPVNADITLTFSENVKAGTGDITLYRASDDTVVQAFDVTTDVAFSDDTVTLNPTSDLDGETAYYVKVDASAIDDEADNEFAGIADATTLNFTTADIDAPMVSINNAPDVISDLSPFIVTIQFNEDVTGFVMGDVTVGNGSVTAFTQMSASQYTVEITPSVAGDVTIGVSAAVAKDAAGNDNLAAAERVVSFDSVPVTTGLIGAMLELRTKLILGHGPNAERRLNRLKGTYANNGGVSGFGLGYANDTLPFALTVGEERSSFSYSLRNARAASGKQGVSGNVGSLANSILGSPRNGSTPTGGLVPGDTHSLAYSGSLSAAEKPALGMNDNLVPASGYAPSGSTQDTSSANGAAPLAMFGDGDADGSADLVEQRYDLWMEGQYTKLDAKAGDGTFAILHAGADYLVTRDVLIGLGAQIDWLDMDASTGSGTAEGWGFMVGPYLTAKLADGLYLDARGAWGQSYNLVSPFGTYEDPFDGTRWLATAALIGDFEAGGFTVQPEARLSYFREQSEAYVDSLMVAIPSVTTETGTVAFGPTIRRRIAMENGTVFTPFTTVTGIWTFEQKNTATALSSQPGLAEEGIRAKLEAGFDVASETGLSLSISGHYDGIGDNGYNAYGGKATVGQKF